MGQADPGGTVPLRVWRSNTDGHCFGVCVAVILDLGPESEDRLAVLPEGFIYEPAAMRSYSDLLERQFGVRLRQLNAPPPHSERLWIACLRTGEDGHAVVARGRTVIYDPAEPEQGGYWGRALPASFGEKLFDGFELVPARSSLASSAAEAARAIAAVSI